MTQGRLKDCVHVFKWRQFQFCMSTSYANYEPSDNNELPTVFPPKSEEEWSECVTSSCSTIDDNRTG